MKGKAIDETCFLEEATELARANIGKGGRPFGTVLVQDGAVVATGVNEILATAHPCVIRPVAPATLSPVRLPPD